MVANDVPCYLCGEEVMPGDDYQSHVQIVHDEEYDEDKITMRGNIDPHGSDRIQEIKEDDDSESFLKTFSNVMNNLKDLAEGRVEPETFLKEDDDLIDIVDDDQIMEMFENIKNKIMKMEFLDKSSQPKMASSFQMSTFIQPERAWYQGTYYNCELCLKTVFGEESFRNHLASVHGAHPKTMLEVRKISLHYEEVLYTCTICDRKVKHEIKSIECHVKTHCTSLEEYETRYIDVQEELGKLPSIKVNLEKKVSDVQETKKLNSPNPSHSKLAAESKVKLKKEPQTIQSETVLPPPTISPHTDKPALNVKAEVNTTSLKPKPQSLYYCPISDCRFFTDKAGMKTSEAALHLKNEHKIKAKDMKPGMYKFEKIKKF